MDPFPFPTVQYQLSLPQDCHMPGNFGLRLGGGPAKVTHAHLARFPEKHHDSQTGFV